MKPSSLVSLPCSNLTWEELEVLGGGEGEPRLPITEIKVVELYEYEEDVHFGQGCQRWKRMSWVAICLVSKCTKPDWCQITKGGDWF